VGHRAKTVQSPWATGQNRCASGDSRIRSESPELDCQVLFTEDQSIALLVLTAPPRTEGYEKLQLLAVLGQERFADTGRG
jgi:hypothetical protein